MLKHDNKNDHSDNNKNKTFTDSEYKYVHIYFIYTCWIQFYPWYTSPSLDWIFSAAPEKALATPLRRRSVVENGHPAGPPEISQWHKEGLTMVETNQEMCIYCIYIYMCMYVV